MRRPAVLAVVWSVLALSSLSCATRGELRDGNGSIDQPRGDELCAYTTFAVNMGRVEGRFSAESMRASFAVEIAKLGLTRVAPANAELLIDIHVSDQTECVHCPEDHNYWRWGAVLSDARSNRFLTQVTGYGSKVVTFPARVTARKLAGLRHCDDTAGAAGWPYVQEKADAAERAISLLGELARIARTHPNHYPDPKLQTEIRELLGVLESVEDLSRFALLASAIAGSQMAEHQNYDGVFDFAQWACVQRIASIPGEEANSWLEHVLKPVLGRDGHPSEELTELIAKQKKLSKSP